MFTVVSFGHLSNSWLGSRVRPLGRVTLSRLGHSAKMLLAKLLTVSGNTNERMPLPRNALTSTFCKWAGRASSVSAVQPSNACPPIVVMPSCSPTDVSDVQP